jgi:hypothetical protein
LVVLEWVTSLITSPLQHQLYYSQLVFFFFKRARKLYVISNSCSMYHLLSVSLASFGS